MRRTIRPLDGRTRLTMAMSRATQWGSSILVLLVDQPRSHGRQPVGSRDWPTSTDIGVPGWRRSGSWGR